jgi:hypothetical protein
LLGGVSYRLAAAGVTESLAAETRYWRPGRTCGISFRSLHLLCEAVVRRNLPAADVGRRAGCRRGAGGMCASRKVEREI